MNSTAAALSQTFLKIHAAISRRHLFLLFTSAQLQQIIQDHICSVTPDLIFSCEQIWPTRWELLRWRSLRHVTTFRIYTLFHDFSSLVWFYPVNTDKLKAPSSFFYSLLFFFITQKLRFWATRSRIWVAWGRVAFMNLLFILKRLRTSPRPEGTIHKSQHNPVP